MKVNCGTIHAQVIIYPGLNIVITGIVQCLRQMGNRGNLRGQCIDAYVERVAGGRRAGRAGLDKPIIGSAENEVVNRAAGGLGWDAALVQASARL